MDELGTERVKETFLSCQCYSLGGAYVTPDLLGGAKSIMIGNVIYSQFMSARDYPFGSAISFVLMAVMLLGTLIYFRLGTE